MHSTPLIYWFRNDLRLHDNPALNQAIKSGQPVIPVFIVDESWHDPVTPPGFSRTGNKREHFLAETLIDLKQGLEEKGNTLHIFKGNSIGILTQLYHFSGASQIMAQREFAWEEIEMEKKLSANVSLGLHWGSMLYQPDQVDFPVEKSPFYFTKFKNKVIAQPFRPAPQESPDTVPAPKNLKIPDDLKVFRPEKRIEKAKKQLFTGGESEAIRQMTNYISSGGPLHYAETRNQLQGENFSSKLGPWLAIGALSPRSLLAELNVLEEKYPGKADNIQPLIEQLIWRDNFRFLFLRYGKRFFTTKGLRKADHGMYDDIEAFELWRKGQTGEPLIDALMHELDATGFMSNRGRMLVAFYLSKVMKVNWQWGAAWFESALLDYDVCSNYGNWAYQSGRGTDSRVNRKFNLATQAKKFDPDGKYVKKWL